MKRNRILAGAILCGLAAWTLQAALAADDAGDKPTPDTIGARIFADPGLSASGDLACATCHDPANAHAQSKDLPVQLGGAHRDVPGFRAVPSLRYTSYTPTFGFDDEGAPIGGFDRDGRANDLMAQAIRPLFAAHEMANESVGALVTRLANAPYADQFRRVFGARVFEHEAATLRALLFALAQYEKLDPDFRPFDSKYDRFLQGSADRIAPTSANAAIFAARSRFLRCATSRRDGCSSITGAL
ncbi:MAG TPA: cytochrome-c peroxidase [Casimicrobiaceae bacterium]|jgi:cytochrome c peroxidase